MTATPQADGTAPRHAADPSLGTLVSEASESLSAIIRGEVALAKVELRSSIKNAGASIALFIASAVLLGFSLTFGLLALAEGLIALGLPRWAGYLAVFVMLLVIIAILLLVARQLIKKVKAPTRTIETGRETVDYLKSHPKSVQ